MLLAIDDSHREHLSFLTEVSLDGAWRSQNWSLASDYKAWYEEYLKVSRRYGHIPLPVVREFCRISIEFIKTGATPKVYQAAAQKLGVEASTVQHGVEGLMYLMTESGKLMLNDMDFQDSILTLGFPDELTAELLSLYQEHRAEVRHLLSELAMDLPHYHNLEWRLDIQLASRSLRHQVTPTILLKLHTKEGDETQSQVLQTDPVNLIHLTRTLEEALQEMKTPHCRRIVRNI